MSLSCTVSEVLSIRPISYNLERSRDTEYTPFVSKNQQYIMHALVLLCINQYTKFEVPNFSNYEVMIGAKFNKKFSYYRGTADRATRYVSIFVLCFKRYGR